MNPKNTCILVVLAAAVFAFIFFFERHLRPPPPGPVKVLPQLKPAAVIRLQLLLPGEKEIRVERTNDGWQVTYPIVYPAQSAAIENLIRATVALSPETRILPEELKNRLTVNEEFGFDNPQAILTFQQEGLEFTLMLGSLTAPGDQIYARVVGSAEIVIIDADFFKKLVPRNVNAWRDPTFVTLTNLNFDRLTIASASQTFELHRDKTNQIWRMTKPVQTRADDPKIEFLLRVLQKMRVTRFVTDEARADLESFGLQPAILELNFDQGTNHALTLQFGKSPTNDASQIYARRNGQTTVVQVPREGIAPWTSGFQEFRDWHLVRFNDGLPDSMEVFNGQENFALERQSNHWQMIQPPDLPLDTNAMRAFLENLATIQVVRSNNLVNDAVASPDLPVYGLVTPSRRYVLKRDRSLDGASVSNSVFAELDFGTVKDGNISFRRGDRSEESSVYAVKLEDFEKLPATAIQLREHRIWKFSEDDIASIGIRLRGNTVKLLHKGANAWPVDPSSKGILPENELKTEAGAQELCELEAGNWIQRGDKDRANYGFSDQSLQIAVELKTGDTNQRIQTLDFGGISPRGLRYGDVRMDDGQNWIFEFSAVTLDRIMAYFEIHEN